MAEMLLQSHNGMIQALPALPKEWPAGTVRGLCARGGFEVDESWKDGKLTSLTIRSIAGTSAKVRYGDKSTTVNLHPGESTVLDENLQPKG